MNWATYGKLRGGDRCKSRSAVAPVAVSAIAARTRGSAFRQGRPWNDRRKPRGRESPGFHTLSSILYYVIGHHYITLIIIIIGCRSCTA